ncbi:Trk family potassium uptake protein [candidate division KSB1 bacterium]|nr:Trk family potassium uptake protein [candidate division KSB1 bacterium]
MNDLLKFMSLWSIKFPINSNIKKSLNPAKTLALSFFILICLGTVLLILPSSAKSGKIPFLDALFTATSASCVTGLVVVDTGTYWTMWGQFVILFCIQIGGLGIMTFSSFFAYILAKRLSIRSRDILEQSMGGQRFENPGRLLLAIIFFSFCAEIIGGVILSIRFWGDYPLRQAFFLGFFHSISAFCNAGFSPFSNSLVNYQTDLVVNLTIMVLIVLGGIGFWVLFDLKNIFKKKRLVLHSRIVLMTSALLILTGFFLFLLLEWNNSLADMSPGDKVISSFFQSVTARTAGFNSVNFDHLTNSTILFLMLLMFIGASPGSCGGGIKTTTFAAMTAFIISKIRDRQQVCVFNRGVPESVISKSIGITFSVLFLVFTSCLILLKSEQTFLFLQTDAIKKIVFEVVSAIGTVGLSLGITPEMSQIGKVVVILLMYIGRIGPLTLAVALAQSCTKEYRVAEENFWVG